MKLFRNALAVAIALVCALGTGPAAAANMTVKDASNTTHTICSTVQSGIDMPCYLVYGKRPDGTYGPILTDSLGTPISGAFKLQGAGSLAVTTSSARVALPTGPTALLINNGTVDLYFNLGSSSVTATSSNYLLPAGGRLAVSTDGVTYVAALTGSSTSTLAIITGTGNPSISGGGSGAGGGGTSDATAANQTAVQAVAGSDATKATAVQGITGGKAVKVDGSAVTQPVSAASLPLPTGAATAAKQPALGTAGSASTDVITVQGIASGVAQPVSGTVAATQSGTWTVQPGNTANTVAWKVDGSAVTQPVSGSLTNISGTISLPTGAATSANQTTINTSIGTTNTGIGAPADAAWTTGSGSAIALLKAVAGQAISTTPATVKTDQTTHGTTDLVAADITKVGGTAALAGLGNVGSGALRTFDAFPGGTFYNVSVSTATTTEIVPLSGSLVTYVLFDKLIVDGTATLTWKYGTGTNCGTGTTTLTGPYNLTAQSGFSEGNGAAPVMIVPAGKALCLTNSAAVQATGSVVAVQF